MKYKKLTLSTFGVLAIAAPAATVVSCSNEVTLRKEWLPSSDAEWKEKLETAKLFSFKDNLSSWPIRSTDVFEWVFNSRKNGLLPLTRLIDLAGSTTGDMLDLDLLIDKQVNGEDSKPQALKQFVSLPAGMLPKFSEVNAFKSWTVTKDDMIKDQNVFEKLSDTVLSFVNSNKDKNLGMIVTPNSDDVKSVDKEGKEKFLGSSFKISLFALKQVSQTSNVQNLRALMLDKNKFSVDLDQVKNFGGAYTVGHAYATTTFSTDESAKQNVWGSKSTVMHFDPLEVGNENQESANVHNDRANEDHLKAWVGFGPISGTSVTQTEKDSTKDVNVKGYLIQDAKTGLWNFVASMYDKSQAGTIDFMGNPFPGNKAATELQTIYIPMPEIWSFAKDESYSVERIQELIVQKTSFRRVYDFLKGIDKALLDTHANSAKSYVIDLFNLNPFMYQMKDLLMEKPFFEMVLNEIKTNDKEFDIQTVAKVLEWLEDKKEYSVEFWGARRMQLITMLPRFYKNVQSVLIADKNLETFKQKYPGLQNIINELKGGVN